MSVEHRTGCRGPAGVWTMSGLRSPARGGKSCAADECTREAECAPTMPEEHIADISLVAHVLACVHPPPVSQASPAPPTSSTARGQSMSSSSGIGTSTPTCVLFPSPVKWNAHARSLLAHSDLGKETAASVIKRTQL